MRVWSKQAAIPVEHGSWVFLFSPMAIGLALGGQWGWVQAWLVLAVLGAFLSHHPMIILVKVLSKRRPKSDQGSAFFWLLVYGLMALGAAFGLWRLGSGFVLWLVLPAMPVMGWHLWLVSRRAERRKPGLEILGSAALAMSAPAGIWLGHAGVDPQGWLIWVLIVLQNAASIIYAYLRLEQRVLREDPDQKTKFRMAKSALLHTTFNLVLTIGLAMAAFIPVWVWLAFLVQWAELIYGTLCPAIKIKPIEIGIRQMIISIIFTLVFILTWFI